MIYTGSAVTDVGIVKKVNQDSLTLKLANTRWGNVAMAVVCDGLGGLSMGEVASGNMIMSFDRWFRNVMPLDIRWTKEFVKSEWENLVYEMNTKIMEFGGKNGCNLGTTVTAALFTQDMYYCIHVGDSRLYEITDGAKVLTSDHTLVAKEVEQGILTPEQALTDSRRNVLTQCVGVTRVIMPDFICGRVEPQAAYLLCSDGFRHVISDKEVYEMLRYKEYASADDINHSISCLVDLNKIRGERDNISAILVQAGNE